MKTKINIFKFCLTLIALAAFFSCENPTSLGSRLDLLGPVVTIVSPTQRQSMPEKFDLEGTVEDYSGVDRMIVTAVTNNDDFPRQWRYQKGAWEVSGDYGATWSPLANAVWSGKNTSIIWKIPIDMGKIEEGEYTFNVQAWDKGNFSDDNSFKALVLIIDPNPPKVVIIDPYIYKGKDAYESSPLKELHDIPDTSDEWKSTANLGKFITQEFDLKWQIEDTSDVWSFDLRFYPYDIVIDNDPDTGLPDSYIYKYTKNLPPPAPAQDPVNPNGSVKVPALNNGIGYYDDDGEIKNPIDEKTTVKIVAVCYDMAGNANQEKTLGYFIYWPKANTPWIVFTDGMREFKDYSDDLSLANIDADVFMVYPGGGKKVKATAFQAHGVKEVKYVIYKCDTSNDELHYDDNSEIIKQGTLENPPRSSGVYSNIFPWEFDVPSTTGYYVVKAQAFSSQGVPGEEYEMLFKVHDITLPDFPEPPKPDASDPLFMTMVNNKITISGIVRDATEVKTLCMVWINPESENFAAMSQLAYFRDKDYNGWKEALLLDSGTSGKEGQKISTGSYPYDPNEPNRLWKLSLTDKGLDSENRKCFEYSQVIDLDDLNIGMGKQPLKSQIFLLRAENPSEKCTIITYAPQGDTLPPKIEITVVVVGGEEYKPREYSQIPKFQDTNTITIKGTWEEDSVEFLDIQTYFLPNFEIFVNNQKMSALNIGNITVTGQGKGTWEKNITVGSGTGQMPVDKLKDSLVIGVNVKDIGGNVAQD
ncbi:MAG: hypothetical protein LBI04_04820, partial [Treponema sp.]|nr:hypothetical protein [Treponema sp.]